MEISDKIERDFNRIASLDEGWTHNSFFYKLLSRHVPEHCGDILEIGCGTGDFTRMIALKSEHVLAIDLSPEMIRVAENNLNASGNIEYCVRNIIDYDWPDNHFDCIVSIATLHHLPLGFMLEKMACAVKPGGRILILDMLRAEGIMDYLLGALSFPLSRLLMLIKKGRLREPENIRRAWEEHGKDEIYSLMSELIRLCDEYIPGAKIKRHLLWRYSVIWIKPFELREKNAYENLDNKKQA